MLNNKVGYIALLVLVLSGCGNISKEENKEGMVRALTGIGARLEKEDLNDEAIVFYNKALESSENKSEIFSRLFKVLEKNKNFVQIIKIYEANKLIIISDDLKLRVIGAYIRCKYEDKALVLIKELQINAPKSPLLENLKGVCFEMQKDILAAKKSYLEALDNVTPEEVDLKAGISANLQRIEAVSSLT